ncbi:methionine ABC transporter permease [Sporolactobacillus laevolacticus]|jgi:D-methionine transport system permease protein|uniref:ABC transporter permease n=1 Tax=Sporolactobacillus laevolacticus DSM 442 TaxID=1395513 RepID=V6IYA2_9BACL|nr:methionine ABC transporter permease [Sporolactobacillus laevolacticus]EST12355.1 ABC transporter permease [Sporolactobacillus laevolacticus DSM 442]MDF2909778.1 transporter permease [Sporolactobacillus laevolacticus]
MADFLNQWGDAIWEGFIQTTQMTLISLAFSILIGLPLGVLLVLTRKNGQWESIPAYTIVNSLINVIRSIPFIILLFFLLPFTRAVAGTTIGVKGVIVPLVVACAPYIARLLETAMLEVSKGVIEAYQSMGISTPKIIWHVIIREARSSIILGLTIAIIGLIGETAMAGFVGAGGLGDLAYQFGYVRFQPDVMYAVIIILIIIVQIIQSLGNVIARKLKKN